VERVGQDLDALGRGALLRDHAAELGSVMSSPSSFDAGTSGKAGWRRSAKMISGRMLAGLQILQHVAGLLVEHLGVPTEARRDTLARLGIRHRDHPVAALLEEPHVTSSTRAEAGGAHAQLARIGLRVLEQLLDRLERASARTNRRSRPPGCA